MKGRFAPSPTGHIHLGNVWVALLAYLSTRSQGGDFLVRMEDIDKQRSKRQLGETLLDDLEWLGFDWDQGPRVSSDQETYWQSIVILTMTRSLDSGKWKEKSIPVSVIGHGYKL